ncbi:hypothetical protein [Bradyrhizobium prioriisuperbiae]|uniref:hypothetical protein n=1 Tax=Bradyrhizobium prioriisuperbiae TaxID=2854389 RepID=UPI0028EFE416|nr:hypothetical protein [Bradyrhizobium prioritasuperba]
MSKISAAAVAVISIVGGASVAQAGGFPASGRFVVACENGAHYRLEAASTTVFGEVVTGRLLLSPRRAVAVRLIPMGDGYRYAGRGVWLDGFREQAALFLRKDTPVSCNVAPI